MSIKETERGKSISLNKIKIKDNFWNKYIKLVDEVLLPYQWDILNDRLEDVETSHCIKNFKIAAKEAEGEFKGAVFQDTDIAKWLEAAAYTLAATKDEALKKIADETIQLIGKAQQEDGYINTYFTIKAPNLRWTNLKEGHELYTAGHLIEAAVAYYEATGEESFLNIVKKFADLLCNQFGTEENKCHGYPGHQEIELALIRLYEVTKEKKYLELAKYFIDARGQGENYFLKEEKNPLYRRIFPEFEHYDTKYSQSHLPVREQNTAEGHAVRAVYMYCAMADLAWYYKDKELMSACEAIWNNITQKRMYITGGIGSSGILERFTTDYDLPNDCNYSETCASIGLALFGKRMGEITRNAKYFDIVEKSLYNTILAGIAMDGKSFFYVNPLEVWPDNCMERTSKEHVKPIRQTWFGVACCPPNVARTLASLGQYIYFTADNTLYTNLYISNETVIELAGGTIEAAMNSDFTNSGNISISFVKNNIKETVYAAFRIPSYVDTYRLVLEDNEDYVYHVEQGYLKFELKKEKIDIKLQFQVPARFVRANPNVRADIGKVAIMKGPIVYCLEEIDNGTNLPAVFVNAKQEIKESFEREFLGGMTVLHLTGRKLVAANWIKTELYSEKEVQFEEIELKAVPYHCWGNRKAGEMLVWLKEDI